jgi:hypothetical protein
MRPVTDNAHSEPTSRPHQLKPCVGRTRREPCGAGQRGGAGRHAVHAWRPIDGAAPAGGRRARAAPAAPPRRASEQVETSPRFPQTPGARLRLDEGVGQRRGDGAEREPPRDDRRRHARQARAARVGVDELGEHGEGAAGKRARGCGGGAARCGGHGASWGAWRGAGAAAGPCVQHVGAGGRAARPRRVAAAGDRPCAPGVRPPMRSWHLTRPKAPARGAAGRPRRVIRAPLTRGHEADHGGVYVSEARIPDDRSGAARGDAG